MTLGFWDRSDEISNKFIAERSKQISLFYKNSVSSQTPYYVDKDIDQLLSVLSLTKYKYALIQSFGHLTMRRTFFERLFEEIKKNDFFLMGHILDHKEHYFELHHQCFVVNLDYFREFSLPKFGKPEVSTQKLYKTIRSLENFHDDYTPYWVSYAEEETVNMIPKFEGWNLINTSIKNKKKVLNFSQELRNLKNYLYPHATIENFEIALKTPSAIFKIENINPCQQSYLKGMAYNWEAGQKSIFIFNTERLENNHRKLPLNEKLDALFCVAAGFKPLKILADNGFNTNTEVVYFDFSYNSLDLRKKMVTNWNGINYVDFLKTLIPGYKIGHYQAIPSSEKIDAFGDPGYADIPVVDPDWAKHEVLWKNTLDDFGGQNNFLKYWLAKTALKHSYLNENIMNISSEFIKKLMSFKGKNVAIYWSNTFSIETTFCYLDKKLIDQSFNNLIFLLKSLDANFYIYGTTPEGIDLQHKPNLFYREVL